MIRDIITIDEAKCTGCGLCIPGCPEGALRIIDGKARLVQDRFCDGLGACLGECPEDAIHVERREAAAYDEATVIDHIVRQGEAVVEAHLAHLAHHGEAEYLEIAKAGIARARLHDGGSRPRTPPQWPVQLHLVPPDAPFFRDADVVIAADCTAFAAADFHERFLQGRPFAIACPKLDTGLDAYREKITAMIDESGIRNLTVVMMQVPCCRGLLVVARSARDTAARHIPIRSVIMDIKGNLLSEEETT